MADARAKRIGLAAALVVVLGAGLAGWRWPRSPAPKGQAPVAREPDRRPPPRLAHAVLKANDDGARVSRRERGPHIAGRVMTEDGQPVPGAKVTAAPTDFVSGRAACGTVVSDAAGDFRIDALEPNNYRLVAHKDGLVGTIDRPIALASAGVAGVVITVRSGAVVTGTVNTWDGKPIAGARVTFGAPPNALVWLADHQATSDAHGRYRIEGLAPGTYRVRAQADGPTLDEDGHTIPGPATHDFYLGEGIPVRVLVLDGSDRPVAGAAVRAWAFPDVHGHGGGFGSDEGITDTEGRFTSIPMDGALVTVVASTRDALGKVESAGFGGEGALTVRLARGARVSGTVSWDDGQPASGVMLLVEPKGTDDPVAAATSGPQGEFTLGPFSTREIQVPLRAPGAIIPSLDDGPLHGRVTLAAGEHRAGVKMILARSTASIAGVVLGPDQRPVPGVVVRAAREGNDEALLAGASDDDAITGGDGAFVVEDLPPGKLNVLVEDPRYAPLLRPGVPANTRDLRLRLQRGATIEGVAVTAEGAPVTAYELSAIQRGLEGPGAFLSKHRNRLRVEDGAGAFHLEHLAAGAYVLMAFAEGRMARTEVMVADGERRKGLRLVVTPPTFTQFEK